MTVLNIVNAPPKLRGFLTIYMWEINSGVYVGELSGKIRELIWKRVVETLPVNGHAVIVFASNNEQGFDFDVAGSAWQPIDYEGLKLILHPADAYIRAETEKPKTEYIVLDLETTGLDIRTDRILEIGAILVADGVCKSNYEKLIKTTVPKNITDLTGITQSMADGGEEIEKALQGLALFINGRDVIGYNIRKFDGKILQYECKRAGQPFPLKKIVDVMELARKSVNGSSSYKMRAVASCLGLGTGTGHRAINDCEMCMKIYEKILNG